MSGPPAPVPNPNLPARVDYLKRTLSVVTLDEWEGLVRQHLALAKMGDHKATRWITEQVGMAQASQVHITLQPQVEAGARRTLAASTLRAISTEDLQAIAARARERAAKVVVDVEPEKPPR